MANHGIAIALFGLLAVLGILAGFYFVGNSRKRTRDRKKVRDDQASRERVAEKRMAENGGLPLSARFASVSIVPRASSPGAPIYPEGKR